VFNSTDLVVALAEGRKEPDALIFQADCVDWEAHRLWDFDQLTHVAQKSRVSGFLGFLVLVQQV
jgi:hypothetical protein